MRRAQTRLGGFPQAGPEDRKSPIPGARRLVVGDYVLTYDLSDTSVDIIAIRHGRMQSPEPDQDFDYEAES